MVNNKNEKNVLAKQKKVLEATTNSKVAGKTQTNLDATAIKESSNTQIKSQKEFDPYNILKFPLSTEKSIRQIEFDNKISFVVDKKATKPQIKRAVEEMFKVKVVKVNTQNSFRGQKRAYVKLSPEHLASDISGDLGLI